ncbi:MAG: tRNA nucleotidyltransferase/poly(A) polymerase [Verrucomicrobiales bacterium]|jgi:tRNA nucleotidyltransferase/poly(A) polymerase
MQSHVPTEERAAAAGIVDKLQSKGYAAYFAGGCVRDQMLGKIPIDYDIATDARPEQIKHLLPGAHGVGAHFGVMLVRTGGYTLEIATFRRDGNYSDGRRPEQVTFAAAEEDAQRRDFTINGLFYDPVEERIIDHVDGQTDLENGILRAIGNPEHRFKEDHLRLMRAVRFAAVLGFAVESDTWQAVCAQSSSLSRISIERVREEFSRIMISSGRVRGFDLLVESGLMDQIIPEIEALKGCEQPPAYHPEGDVFVHTRLMLSLLPEQTSLPLVLSVLLHDIAKPATRTWDDAAQRVRFNGHAERGAEMTEKILKRLKYPNDIIDATVAAVGNHMAFINVQDMRTSKLKRFIARQTFEDELALHRVDCLGSHGMLENYTFLQNKRDEFASEPLIPPRLITGNDLIALGWKPSPIFSKTLTQIQDLQLEGTFRTRDDAMQWLHENYPSECGPG